MEEYSMSGASSRRRGNAAEQAIVRNLNRHGYAAITSRNARGGSQQGVDIVTDFPLAIEVKSQARMELAGWVDQAVSQADDSYAVVCHKRRGRADPDEWYATMRWGDLVALVGWLSSKPLDDEAVPW